MLINPRISLLFLVVGSFMGIWSQDQQPSVETVIAEARQLKQETMLADTTASDEDSYEPHREVHRTGIMASSESTIDLLELDVHVPAGFYQAVNHNGASKLIRVLENAQNRNSAVRDFYTHESNGNRWYLIRLTNPAIASQKFQTIR